MSQTRHTNTTTAFRHVMDNVLSNGTANPRFEMFFQAVGVTTTTDLLRLSIEDLNHEYHVPIPNAADPNDPYDDAMTHHMIKLLPAERNKLLDLIKFYNGHDNRSAATWFTMTYHSFEEWRDMLSTTDYPTPAPTTTTTTSGTPPMDHTLDTFLKGSKCSITEYDAFKQEYAWPQWKRKLISMAATHNVDNVLIPDYTPDENSPTEVTLFEAQQSFMFGVFNYKLETAYGCLLLKEHQNDRNAQMIFAKLCLHYDCGTAAALRARQLEQYLSNLHLDNSWNKTCQSFLMHFRTNLFDLDEVREEPVSEVTKVAWLRAAMLQHERLSYTMNTYTTMYQAVHNGDTPSFDTFFQFLLDRAKEVDDLVSQQQRQQRQNHNSNQQRHGRAQNNQNRNNSNNNRQNTNKVSTRLPDDVWAKMTPDQCRQHIYKNNNRSRNRSNNNRSNTNSNSHANSTTQVNTAQTQAPSPATVPPSDATTSTNTTIATMNTTPTIRTILSNRSTTVHPTTAPIDTISFNGLNYRQINTTKLHYRLSNHHIHTDIHGSLLDGGANGGMCGTDVTILEYTDNSADVTGIADQTLTNLPIVTAAGFIETMRGPIIGIFHQYAHNTAGRTIHSLGQLRSFGLDICDKSRLLNGQQQITTPDGYTIPLAI